MRIGVLSDTHGMRGKLSNALMRMEAEGPVDALFHLGDGYDDLVSLKVALPPVYQVAGNCDTCRTDTLNLVSLAGTRFLLTHGHLQRVRYELDTLYAFALRQKAQVALFGHTHEQHMEQRDGILLLNPGTAMQGCFAVLELTTPEDLRVKLYD